MYLWVIFKIFLTLEVCLCSLNWKMAINMSRGYPDTGTMELGIAICVPSSLQPVQRDQLIPSSLPTHLCCPLNLKASSHWHIILHLTSLPITYFILFHIPDFPHSSPIFLICPHLHYLTPILQSLAWISEILLLLFCLNPATIQLLKWSF